MQSQSTSSSQSSQKFNLDEKDDSDILVYKVRHGYTITTQRQLCKELDKSPTKQRCSRKPIPSGCSRVEIQTRDLFNEPEKSAYSHYPNATSSLASVGLPRKVYWRRMLMGHFREIFIVSPDNSPDGSPDGSSRGGSSPIELYGGSGMGNGYPEASPTTKHDMSPYDDNGARSP